MSFGHPRLTSSDIAPTTLEQFSTLRTLTPEQESGLWAAFGAAIALPYVWSSLESVSVVAVLIVATVVVALASAMALAPSAVRFGIGTGVLARAVLGPDAAVVFHIVRYTVVTAWAAELIKGLAHWTALYVQAVAPTVAPLLELEWTASSELVEGLACVVIGALCGVIARGRVRRSRRSIKVFAFFASLCVGGLVVFGVWRVPLTLDAVLGPAVVPRELAKRVSSALLVVPVLAFAAPEWIRYRGEHLRRGFLARLPRPLVNALAVAVLATLVTVSSRVIRHRMDFALVGDASGAFGLVLGGVALLLAVLLTFAVVPLFGVLNASNALCSALPRLRYPWVARATGLLAGVLAIAQLDVPWLLTFMAPPLVMLLVDEWIVRRHTVVLDALYEPGRPSFTGMLGLVGAWLIIGLFRETEVACAFAALAAALPILTRPRAPQEPKVHVEPTPAEEDWTESPKLDESDWSPDDVTRGK